MSDMTSSLQIEHALQLDLYSTLLLLASGQGLFFTLLLIFGRLQRRSINIHLSIMLFAISIEVLQQFLVETNIIYQVPYLIGMALPFDALVGISLFWYVRLITFPEKPHSRNLILTHYSIFAISVLFSIPFWNMPFNDKLALVESGVISNKFNNWVFYGLWIQTVLKIVSFSIYLLISIKMLLEHKRRIQNIFSYREKVTLSWLSNMLWLFLIGLIQAISILVFFQDSPDEFSMMGFMAVFSITTILYLGVMGVMQPRVFRRSERSYLEKLETDSVDEKHPSPEKYKKSALSVDDMKRIAAKLNNLLDENPLFLNPDLTMPQLAKHLTVSPNYLSQTLNNYLELSFFDFINKKRVDFAKKILSNPEKKNMSVIDIAIESAFNSRSAFYSAFKKHVGLTPIQFRNEQL